MAYPPPKSPFARIYKSKLVNRMSTVAQTIQRCKLTKSFYAGHCAPMNQIIIAIFFILLELTDYLVETNGTDYLVKTHCLFNSKYFLLNSKDLGSTL